MIQTYSYFGPEQVKRLVLDRVITPVEGFELLEEKVEEMLRGIGRLAVNMTVEYYMKGGLYKNLYVNN